MGSGRQGEHPLAEGLGDRQRPACLRIEGTIGLHAVTAGIEITPGQHAMTTQADFHGIAAATKSTRVDLQDDVLVVVAFGFGIADQGHTGEVRHARPKGLQVESIDRDEMVQAVEIDQPHGGADFRHLAIHARIDHGVLAGKPEVLHPTKFLCQLRVIGGDGPALEGIEDLGGVKAEDLAAAEVANRSPPVRAAEGVGGVEHQGEPVPVGDRLQGFNRAGPPVKMHGQDTAGRRCDGPLDCGRVEVVRHGVDVRKDGPDALPMKRMCRGDEGQRWNDHLAGEIQGADGQLQCLGAVGRHNAMGDLEVVCQALFQLLHERAVIGKPDTVEHLAGQTQKLLAVADVGAANVEGREKGWGR